MGIIHVLPDHVVNQIAAGEVIERPAAAVKELLENSLDAGATRIQVCFRQGGKAYLSVQDNGQGMLAEDAALAFQRHATSKITQTQDLFKIASFGFRGEALPSIASVARCVLKTRRPQDTMGHTLCLEHGKILWSKPCGSPPGSTLEVEHLFGNIPARRKFLKSDATESAHIMTLLRTYALAYLEVAFSLYEDQTLLLQCLPSVDLSQRVSQLWGSTLAQDLLPIQVQHDGLGLHGLILAPGKAGRPNRKHMLCFVNGRPVVSRVFSQALTQAYRAYLPRETYPVAFLFLKLDPAQVDVNVHPAKLEVRFRNELKLQESLYLALETTLHRAAQASGLVTLPSQPFLEVMGLPTLGVSTAMASQQAMAAQQPLETSPLRASPLQGGSAAGPDASPQARLAEPFEAHNQPAISLPAPLQPLCAPAPQPAAAAVLPAPVAPGSVLPWRFIQMLQGRYALFESDSGLVILHCRAAHERVLFETISQALNLPQKSQQALLIPELVHLSAAEAALVQEHSPRLHNLGFTCEAFGPHTYRLCSIPSYLEPSEAKSFFLELLERIDQSTHSTLSAPWWQPALLRLCQQRATRLGDSLHASAATALATALMHCKSPLVCPRGKPTLQTVRLGSLFKA
jgi:DNA mismatch repair protein MutL